MKTAAFDLFPGVLTTADFHEFARAYRSATGFTVMATDAHGRRLAGAFPAGAESDDCRAFRAQAISEALRWGEPCVGCCACGRALWAVPVMQNQRLCGGLVVAGVALRSPRQAGALDRRIVDAGTRLLELAVGRNWTNAALLAERRHFARREGEKAEALHALKDSLRDDIRSAYLHEEPALLASIRRGDRREARRILNRVLTAIYAVGRANTAVLKSLALELVVMMTRAAVQAGGKAEKILGFNYQSLTTLARIGDQEALAAWLCEMLEELIDAIEQNTRRSNTVLLARALEFMEGHLAENIGRDEVARAAGLSASRFSHLMRVKTGWSFMELLTRLRVDRACHLLAHTDRDLAQVALECGYGDQSYFNRVFRRTVGDTPGAYRRQHRSEHENPKQKHRNPRPGDRPAGILRHVEAA